MRFFNLFLLIVFVSLLSHCSSSKEHLSSNGKQQGEKGEAKLARERVHLIPLRQNSPDLLGVFDDQGNFLYSLPQGSESRLETPPPLNSAVINRMVKLPDASLVWVDQSGTRPISGLEVDFIQQASNCTRNRNIIANVPYFDPFGPFCLCYRDGALAPARKLYFTSRVELISNEAFLGTSSPMNEGLALVQTPNETAEEGQVQSDGWSILSVDGSLQPIDLNIDQPLSAFHQGQILIMMRSALSPNNILGFLKSDGSFTELPQETTNRFLENRFSNLVVPHGHGYWLMSRYVSSRSGNAFLLIDKSGNIVRSWDNVSQVSILNADRFLVISSGTDDAPKPAWVENLSGERIAEWSQVRKMQYPTGRDNGRLLLVGTKRDGRLLHIDENGQQIANMEANDAYRVGPDSYLRKLGQRRSSVAQWVKADGQVILDTRWLEREVQWAEKDNQPAWSINSLKVQEESDIQEALQELSNFAGLSELILGPLSDEMKIENLQDLLWLERLSLDRANAKQIGELLALMPNLKELQIYHLTDESITIDWPVLDQLTKLNLIARQPAGLTDWMDQQPYLNNIGISSDNADFRAQIESWGQASIKRVSVGTVFFTNFGIEGEAVQDVAPVAPERN